MTAAFLLSGHAGPLSPGDCSSIQNIADALAGAGLTAVRMDELKTAALFNALGSCNGNRTQAAKTLGISVRTLQRHLKGLSGSVVGEPHEAALES